MIYANITWLPWQPQLKTQINVYIIVSGEYSKLMKQLFETCHTYEIFNNMLFYFVFLNLHIMFNFLALLTKQFLTITM